MASDEYGPMPDPHQDIEEIHASFDDGAHGWEGTADGSIRIRRSGGRVYVSLDQWEDKEHEVAITAYIEPATARDMAKALRAGEPCTIAAPKYRGGVHRRWVNTNIDSDNDVTDIDGEVRVLVLTDDGTELRLRYAGDDGVIITRTSLSRGLRRQLAVTLEAAADRAEAYEPVSHSSGSSVDTNHGPWRRAAINLISATLVLAIVSLVAMDVMGELAGQTITFEPIQPNVTQVFGAMAVLTLLAVIVLWGILRLPRGGRFA